MKAESLSAMPMNNATRAYQALGKAQYAARQHERAIET
jgi:hypothetical protein